MTEKYTDLFFEQQAYRRHYIRSQGEAMEVYLNEVYNCTFGAIASYQSRVSGVPFEEIPPELLNALSLIAQFLQGAPFVKAAIWDGYYPQAAALLKQQLETITALEECKTMKRKEGQTPNVGNAWKKKNFKSIYSQLNLVAHPSVADAVGTLAWSRNGTAEGPGTIPMFQPDVFKNMLQLSVHFLFQLFRQCRWVFETVFSMRSNEEEDAAVYWAIDRMKALGFVDAEIH